MSSVNLRCVNIFLSILIPFFSPFSFRKMFWCRPWIVLVKYSLLIWHLFQVWKYRNLYVSGWRQMCFGICVSGCYCRFVQLPDFQWLRDLPELGLNQKLFGNPQRQCRGLYCIMRCAKFKQKLSPYPKQHPVCQNINFSSNSFSSIFIFVEMFSLNSLG